MQRTHRGVPGMDAAQLGARDVPEATTDMVMAMDTVTARRIGRVEVRPDLFP